MEIRWRTPIDTLEYFVSFSEFGITFERGSILELLVFNDDDCASKVMTTYRRSVSGGSVMYTGAYVCRFPRTHKCVTLWMSLRPRKAQALGMGVATGTALYRKKYERGRACPTHPSPLLILFQRRSRSCTRFRPYKPCRWK